MFNRKSQIMLSMALTALACVASSAFARTVPAVAGHPYEGANTCFKDYEQGMKNECGSTEWYDIGMALETGGSKTISVYGSALTSCYFIETTNAGSVVESLLMTAFGTGDYWITNTVTAGNFVKVQCTVPNNTYIYGVDYTP